MEADDESESSTRTLRQEGINGTSPAQCTLEASNYYGQFSGPCRGSPEGSRLENSRSLSYEAFINTKRLWSFELNGSLN